MAPVIERQLVSEVPAIKSLAEEKKDDDEYRHMEVVEKAQGLVGADLEGAMVAEQEESEMTFKEAIRDYKAAVFWSFAISLCIIMEGYDTALPVSL